MVAFAYIVLCAWPLIVFALWLSRSPQQALVGTYVFGWCFLPMLSISLPGFPDYSKYTVASYATLPALLLFADRLVWKYRPCVMDALFLALVIGQGVSVFGIGLGPYEFMSAMVYSFITWFTPYICGRIVLRNTTDLKTMLVIIVLAAIIYIPFCLYEIRFSPQLHNMIYGYHQHSFAQTVRYGGYRPTVFMQHGLQVGLWMVSSAMLAWWLNRFKLVRPYFGALNPGWSALALVIVAFLCKSTGAILIGLFAVACLWLIIKTNRKWPLWAFLSVFPLYIFVSVTRIINIYDIVPVIDTWLGSDRAGSFRVRIDQEIELVNMAWQKPLFGWSAWSSGADQLWTLVVRNHGFVGLALLVTIFVFPCVRACQLISKRGTTPHDVAILIPTCVFLGMFYLDSLFNAMVNPLYFVALGGLVSATIGLSQRK